MRLLQEHALSSQVDLVSDNSSAPSSCAIVGKSVSLSLILILSQMGILFYEDYMILRAIIVSFLFNKIHLKMSGP